MNYQNRIVLFLDILGFKKHIQDTIQRGASGEIDNVENIQKLDQVLSKMGGIAGLDSPNKSSVVVTQFSDSIVISFSEQEPAKSEYVFKTILKIILHLVKNKIICRGALSFGKLIHNKRMLFGPALVDAYETESKAAMYPRVIMDKNIYDFARMYTENDQIITSGATKYLSKDMDGKYYIDYFKAPYYVFGKHMTTEYYEALREIIISGLRFSQPDLRVKYGWMREKYNAFLKDMKEIDSDSSSSKVLEYLHKLSPLK